jgi:hypothetical protein
VPEQRQQPELLPGTGDQADQQGTCQQQWSWKWGSSISYTQAGCPSDGRPALLLLHGFGVSHKHFVHNIEVLAEQYAVRNIWHGKIQSSSFSACWVGWQCSTCILGLFAS